MIRIVKKVLSFIIALPVHIYRYSISPFLPPACRHVPSCSEYMLSALKIHGPFAGMAMGIERILRCRPGGTHGYDPVPVFKFKKYRPVNSIFHRWKKENRLKRG